MQWFKHMSDMSFDPKVKRVLRKYGVEGYGLYCYVLESIARNLKESSPYPELEEVSEDLAADLKMDSRKVEEIMMYMVKQGLFDFRDASDRVVCMKMIDYLDEYHRKRGKLSPIRKALQDIEVRHCPDKLPTLSGQLAQEEDKEEEKNRVEKNKKTTPKKHKHGEYKHVLLSEGEYNRLVHDWGEEETERMIKRLDEGIELKGYKYNSHNLALRKWRKREGAKQGGPITEFKEVDF